MTNSVEIAAVARDNDADIEALAQRHVRLLKDVVAKARLPFTVPVQISVVAFPAFSDSARDDGPPPPSAHGLTSPWMVFDRSGAGIGVTVFVSDLRGILDTGLLARTARPEGYDTDDGFGPITHQCLSASAQAYVDLVTSGGTPDKTVFADGCVPAGLAPHLLAFFVDAPQVYFAPFEHSVLTHLAATSHDRDQFYRQLYPELLMDGVAALSGAGAARPDWWYGAVRAVSK